jgi:hypothetical protein
MGSDWYNLNQEVNTDINLPMDINQFLSELEDVEGLRVDKDESVIDPVSIKGANESIEVIHLPQKSKFRLSANDKYVDLNKEKIEMVVEESIDRAKSVHYGQEVNVFEESLGYYVKDGIRSLFTSRL